MGKIAEDEKVDFVILWVDGNDPEWQANILPIKDRMLPQTVIGNGRT